jgi:hypothetical protein
VLNIAFFHKNYVFLFLEMNYTESLITVLNKKEIEQIRSSELTKAERTIFETLVTNRLPEHQRKKITAKSCGMTDAYFRKTNAEFLKMMFSIITPEGGLTTLRLLKNRFLLPLFRHEMKKQESILLSFSTNDQKRIFYRSALVLSGGFPFAQGLKIGSLLRQVRKNFFSSGVEISSADRIFFESIILEWDINYLHYLKKENKFRKERKRFAMLATLFSETENIDMDAAHSFHATALKLSSVDPLDKEAMLFHSRTIYELTTKNPKEVNALSYGKGKYHYVSTLLNLGMTEEAYQLLIQAAKSDPEGIMRPNILSMYIVTAITLDRYDEIEPLMLRAYDRFTEENNDAYLMFIVDQYISATI